MDWEARPLAAIGECLIGLTYAPRDVAPTGVLVLRSSNIGEGGLQFDDNVFVNTCVPEKIIIQEDDLLICVRNGSRPLIGKCALIDKQAVGMTFGAFMSVFRSRINRFVFYCFQSDIVKRQIHEHLGATINQITNRSLNSFHIPYPEEDEQNAIAEVLSDVDRLIGTLETLIAKKRAIKQAAMQQLITGKIRLPGFSGKWETKRLGEFASIRNQKVLPANVAPEILCVELDHIGQNNGRLVTFSTAGESTSIKYRFQAGDVLFGRLRSYLRKFWLADAAGICTTEVWPLVVDPKQAVAGFLYAVVQTDRFLEAASISYGTHMPRADWRIMRNLKVCLPQVSEQQTIAAVFSDMDAELEALERLRGKTKQIKQGMMQQLLTGRVRLLKRQVQTAAESNGSMSHSWAFNEAVVISTLVKHFGKEDYPLGRKRYTKLSYLLHRQAEKQAAGYLKKAAGPYNPRTKYGGPERIAIESGYIREHKSGPYSGFVAADNISLAENYFDKWYGPSSIKWLNQFRFKTNDELELLATVDMAAEELSAAGTHVDVASVETVIGSHPEWQAKLDRAIFAAANIAKAIETSRDLFDATSKPPS